MATLAVVMAPLAIFAAQMALGYWGEGKPYRDYHVFIDWRWIMLEFGTLAVGAVGKFAYCVINVLLILAGAVLGRRLFVVFGGLGLAVYLGDLSWRVFKDSLVFPFALSMVGLAIVWLGVLRHRHEVQWSERLRSILPTPFRELLDARAPR